MSENPAPTVMSAPGRAVRFARDAHSGVEAIRATFTGHAYDLHRHEQWLIGVTDYGLQEFSCRGIRQRSTTGRIMLIEPEEAHDGDAVTAEGFGYRMLYVPQAWLRDGLDASPGISVGFRSTLTDDVHLGHAIRAACDSVAGEPDQLSVDAALDAVLRRLRPHLGQNAAKNPFTSDSTIAQRARDYLHAAMADQTGADALARAAGAADRFQLARAFRLAYGTAPHAYLLQIRLLRARRLLAEGHAPIDVAVTCGFADQSHLGRWFRRAYGLTPAAYRSCCTGVPDRARRSS
jgi:AraC-like DNA-binding protein